MNLLQDRSLAAQRTKRKARKQWLADLDPSRSGMAFGPSAFLSSHECGCPGCSPKPSSFPSQSPGRITMITRATEAENRLWILKYTLLTYLLCKLCTKQYLFPHLQPHHAACGILVPLPKRHLFKALFQISSITGHFFLTLCFIRYLLYTRLWARPQRNIMNNAQSPTSGN